MHRVPSSTRGEGDSKSEQGPELRSFSPPCNNLKRLSKSYQYQKLKMVFILMYKVKNKVALLGRRQEGKHGEQIRMRTSHRKQNKTPSKPSSSSPKQAAEKGGNASLARIFCTYRPSCKETAQVPQCSPEQRCMVGGLNSVVDGACIYLRKNPPHIVLSIEHLCLLTTLLPLSIVRKLALGLSFQLRS